MAFKFVTFFALVAFVNAGTLVQQQQGQIYQAPSVLLQHENHGDHSYAPANYQFGYSVHDAHTGDIKDQQETRNGDHVRGRYSLVEPDGNRRVVDYSSGPHTGFNAQVRHESPSVHAVAHTAPVAYTQHNPAAITYAQHQVPVAYAQQAAPIAYAQQAAPIAYAQHAAPIAYAQQAAPIAYAHSSAPLISTKYTTGIQHHDGQLVYQH